MMMCFDKNFLKISLLHFFVGHGSAPTLLYNGGLYLILLYIIKLILIKIKRIDTNCATLILLVSIKLSVRNPSIKNRPIEYQVKYKRMFLLILNVYEY